MGDGANHYLRSGAYMYLIKGACKYFSLCFDKLLSFPNKKKKNWVGMKKFGSVGKPETNIFFF